MKWITPVKLPFRAMIVRFSLDDLRLRTGLEAVRRTVEAFSHAFPSISGIDRAIEHLVGPALQGAPLQPCPWASGLAIDPRVAKAFVRSLPDTDAGGRGNGGSVYIRLSPRLVFKDEPQTLGLSIVVQPQAYWNCLTLGANHHGFYAVIEFAQGMVPGEDGYLSPAIRVDKYCVRQATQELVNLFGLNLTEPRQRGNIQVCDHCQVCAELELEHEVLPDNVQVQPQHDAVLRAHQCV